MKMTVEQAVDNAIAELRELASQPVSADRLTRDAERAERKTERERSSLAA